MKKHWLIRPRTIRLLWMAFLLILALTVLANVFTDAHSPFRLVGTFAFDAWFGFVSCIVMILFAKLIGRLLQRKDGYYDRD